MQQIIARIAGLAVAVRSRSAVSSSTPRRRGLYERQDDFARKPFVAPIKTHFTPELANHIFHNACAEPAVRGRRDGRPTRLDPAQTEPSVCCKGPRDFHVTTRCR